MDLGTSSQGSSPPSPPLFLSPLSNAALGSAPGLSVSHRLPSPCRTTPVSPETTSSCLSHRAYTRNILGLRQSSVPPRPLRARAHSAYWERRHTTRPPQHPDRSHRERRRPGWPRLGGETNSHRWKCRKR